MALGKTIEPPLAGIRVLDLSTSYAGPTAATYLADMGASVLKVERIGRGDDTRAWGPPFRDGESAWFHAGNRNKASLALDLRNPGSQQELQQLLAVADVAIVSFNVTKLGRLGLDPAKVRERHPHLVYCAITGFGLAGPDSTLAGYDLTAQARSGLMSVTGARGGSPQRVSTALCDIVAGTIAAYTIAAALVRQRSSGVGELIDVSLLDAGLSLMAPRIASYLAGEPEPAPSGATDSVLAVYQAFETADRPIVVAVGNDDMWQRFCVVIEASELGCDETTKTNNQRRQRRPEITELIQQCLRTASATTWLERFAIAGIPAARVQSLSEVVADPQVRARGSIRPLDNGFDVVRSPWRLEPGDSESLLASVGGVGLDGPALARTWGVQIGEGVHAVHAT